MSRTQREVSVASRLWSAGHSLWPSVSTQPVFEGSGTLDLKRWRKAVAVASAASPGSRMVLKGHAPFRRWADSGITPPVRLMSAQEWDGFGSEGSDVINCYSPRKGPMAEVVLIRGEPHRVVFRAHHALMDGRGVMTWAEDVFRALRGEPVLDSNDRITENDLLNPSPGKRGRAAAGRFIAPTGRAAGNERGVVWRRRRITGRFSRLLPRIMLLTAHEAWRHGEGRVRFSIPVDLRPRRPGLKSTGNLTNALSIDVTPDSTVRSLADEIELRVKERRDGHLTWAESMISFLPLFLIKSLLLREAGQGHDTGYYINSGIISNMGRYSMDAFQGGGFVSHTAWITPICLEMIPFSLCISGAGSDVDLFLAMPKVLAHGGRMDDVLSRIAEGLVAAGENGCRSLSALADTSGEQNEMAVNNIRSLEG